MSIDVGQASETNSVLNMESVIVVDQVEETDAAIQRESVIVVGQAEEGGIDEGVRKGWSLHYV